MFDEVGSDDQFRDIDEELSRLEYDEQRAIEVRFGLAPGFDDKKQTYETVGKEIGLAAGTARHKVARGMYVLMDLVVERVTAIHRTACGPDYDFFLDDAPFSGIPEAQLLQPTTAADAAYARFNYTELEPEDAQSEKKRSKKNRTFNYIEDW